MSNIADLDEYRRRKNRDDAEAAFAEHYGPAQIVLTIAPGSEPECSGGHGAMTTELPPRGPAIGTARCPICRAVAFYRHPRP